MTNKIKEEIPQHLIKIMQFLQKKEYNQNTDTLTEYFYTEKEKDVENKRNITIKNNEEENELLRVTLKKIKKYETSMSF